MSARSARAVLASLVGMLLAACLSGSADPQYFTLSSASGDAAGAPIASRPELGLVVGPLEFPRYLDRPEIVRRDGSHRLILADAHLWGGSLQTDILRVVADDLARLLGTAQVAVYPTEPRFLPDYRVLLDLREFEGVAGQGVRLRARWTIAAVPDGRAIVVEEETIEQPLASSSIEDMVAAESTALGRLTHRIATRLAELPERSSGTR